MRKFLTLIASVILVIFGFSSPAFAHSDAFSSFPEEGSVVADVTELQFTFAVGLETSVPPQAALTSSTGQSFELGAPVIDPLGTSVAIPIASGALPDGQYLAAIRIASEDGHGASYEVNFTVSGSSVVSDPTQTPVPISEPTDEEAVAVTTSAENSAGPGIEFALASIAAMVIVGIGALTIISLRRRRNQDK